MLQKQSTAHSQENSKLQSPKTDNRQEHLDSNRKELIAPTQALGLVQEAKKVTGATLPIIPLPDGSKVQIVTLSDGRFFLCHTTKDSSFPIEYHFNKKGVYQEARTDIADYDKSKTHRETSQEVLREIKAYLPNAKNKSN